MFLLPFYIALSFSPPGKASDFQDLDGYAKQANWALFWIAAFQNVE